MAAVSDRNSIREDFQGAVLIHWFSSTPFMIISFDIMYLQFDNMVYLL